MPIETIMEETELKRAGFDWREREGVRAVICAPLEAEGFSNAFSTRAGGCSPMPHDALNLAGFDDDTAENIYENRRRFIRLFDGAWTLAACWQVHGADVRIVRMAEDARGVAGARGETERCDALTTDAPNVLLGIKTADCVPVLLGDARTGACASVHAGWRGAAASIVKRALETMRLEYGTHPADIRAAIGPAARVCCYEVGAEVIESFRQKFETADELLTPTREGHARIDLQRANLEQLTQVGVAPERIHTLPLCTICRPDLFFSYRREKQLYGRTGRLLSVIGRMESGG